MDLVKEIQKLKKEKNAIILAHYYQRPEIQEIADFVGDSYYLSKIGKDCDEQTIVFCGVKFMAESAKILSPQKTVLLPAYDAGCPMADMAVSEDVLKLKKEHPNAKIVCYINSTTEVKAVSDVCCTSSNAVKIIQNIDADEIIFLPDKNLGSYIQEQVPEKKMILWSGYCITHRRISLEEIKKAKDSIEDLIILAHPECEKEVRDIADFVGSTLEIINYATSSEKTNFLIGTEEGILHELKKRNPNKKFYTPRGGIMCVNMKKTVLIDVYNALLKNQHEIHVNEDIRVKAYESLMKMHILGR
ncbi:quinolinate synthase [Clostridium polyendosporum]|uniref:Quinolinate synthase n=1 Tax=Clostridium polyendosporum TaxID=69208 RepID=A0A919S083_9CLOT|nr:quinolinate synthase NadA [Clostridium polyendosporum]GIM29437.1 quinolinate synthase [Clostridium polyendosporum]